MRTTHLLGFVVLGCAVGACSAANKFDTGTGSGGDGGSSGSSGQGDGGSSFGGGSDASLNGGGDGASGSSAPLIYAHSDTELYSLDPNTNAITDIGPFDDGTGNLAPVTDLAVNANDEVWVNTEAAIYKATLPSGTGTVKLTLVSKIAAASSQYFYALGFAPAGVLDTNETLVAGDNKGELYAIATNGATTDLGSFGTNSSGNPYELSGDLVFFMVNNQPRGLATIRSCQKGGSCSTSNDILAEIDVAAMSAAYQSKKPGNLKKQLLGSGTGFGHLYGVGAWNDKVYAFSRVSGSTAAQLVTIDSTGKGTLVQSFSQITAGWSGAGVTTKANVTVLPPN
jgi:hypothetical protein